MTNADTVSREQIWDSYLEQLIARPEFLSSSGQFFPRQSFFARLFSRSSKPSASSLTAIPRRSQRRRQRDVVDPERVEWDSDGETLAESGSTAPVKYSIEHETDDDERMDVDDDDDDEATPTGSIRPRMPSEERFLGHGLRSVRRGGSHLDRDEWYADTMPMTQRVDAGRRIPPHAVPATPSLILALRRVNAAQMEARGVVGEREVTGEEEEEMRGDDWWRMIEEKAAE